MVNTASIIEGKTFGQERALYGSRQLTVKACSFDGPEDGESALKECSDITVIDCFFNLRYPLWHVHGLKIKACNMSPLCRAAIWYSDNIEILNTKMHGIKALRECSDIDIKQCDINSDEFGWFTKNVKVDNTNAVGKYFMMQSQQLEFNRLKLTGKYSFQYIKNACFDSCEFDTKDAFWHADNVTVKNSIIKGEYLAWYSNKLTLVNCTIIGTQPLCYCKNLKLINCKMTDTDLCFEKSQVDATILSPVISIKNPACGKIYVPSVGSVIMDNDSYKGQIIITDTQL